MDPNAPPPGAVFVMGLIVLVALCFILMLLYKGATHLAARRAAMSSAGWDSDDADDAILAESPATTIAQNSNNGVAITQNERNALLLQEAARVLAIMVKMGKVGETEGIKLAFGCAPSSTNPRYIAARAALKEELAKLDPPKFNLTTEQKQARQALGLEN